MNTPRSQHQYIVRPTSDDPETWELLDQGSGQVLMRGSERLVKAKAGINVDYDSQGAGRKPRKAKRQQ